MDPIEAPATPDKPDVPVIDYEAQYNELRPKFTQTSQEAAELRDWKARIETDEDAQRELLQSLGYEIEVPEPVVYNDPADELRAEVEALKGWRTEREQAEAQQAEARQQADRVEALDADAKVKLEAISPDMPEQVARAIESYALFNLKPLADNTLDIQGAYEALSGFISPAPRKNGKPKVPHFTPGGVEGVEKPNLDDPDARRAWMVSRMAALEAG